MRIETIIFDLDDTIFKNGLQAINNIVEFLRVGVKRRMAVRFLFFIYEIIEYLIASIFGLNFKVNSSAQKIITKKVQLDHIRKVKPLLVFVEGFKLIIITDRSLLGILSLNISGFPLEPFDKIQVRKSILNYFVNLEKFGLAANRIWTSKEIKPHDGIFDNLESDELISKQGVALVDNSRMVRNLALARGFRVYSPSDLSVLAAKV